MLANRIELSGATGLSGTWYRAEASSASASGSCWAALEGLDMWRAGATSAPSSVPTEL